MRSLHRLALAALGTAGIACPGGSSSDDDRLRVVSNTPPHGSEGVSVTATFSISFNHAIDPATVVPSSFRLVHKAPTPANFEGTLAHDGATVTLTPTEALPYDSVFDVEVSGLRDTEGRGLESFVPWQVRTTFGDFDFSTPLPRFVSTHYISSADLAAISRFRSSVGHDYSDDFETCRSMKHYFAPPGAADWAAVQIRSPVAGRVVERYDEWAGTKLVIRSFDRHAFFFEIFHVALGAPLAVGDAVAEGQVLGHHVGSQTMSDIAVGVQTDVDGPRSYIRGRRYVSYFDVLTDAAFVDYQARGVADRPALIITAAERDANALDCSFTGTDPLPAWVTLQ